MPPHPRQERRRLVASRSRLGSNKRSNHASSRSSREDERDSRSRGLLPFEKIHVGLGDEVIGIDAQGCHQGARFSLTGCDGLVVPEHDFEFEKVAEGIHPIEVNAGAADEEKSAHFVHHGADAVGGGECCAEAGRIGGGSDLILRSLWSFLVRTSVVDEFGMRRRKDAEFESAGFAGKEDVFLGDQFRCGIGKLSGNAGDPIEVLQAGFDFDVARHGKVSKPCGGLLVNEWRCDTEEGKSGCQRSPLRKVFAATWTRSPCDASGATVSAVLEAVFANHARLRSYLLDDRGAVRKHVSVIVNGEAVNDREALSDAVAEDAEIFVMQALSGG